MMPDVSNLLAGKTTVVTSTRRLAQHLLDLVEREQAKQDEQVWRTPDILPWATWVEREFEAVRRTHRRDDDRVLLTPLQEQRLWQQLIESQIDDPADHVFQVPATAGALSRARLAALEWDLPLDALKHTEAPDARRFHDWNEEFTARLKSESLVSSADCVGELIEAFSEPNAIELDRLLTAGFDELSPRQQRLLDALANQGVEVAELASEDHGDSAERVVCQSTIDELQAMALWVRQCLVENRDANVGVIVPDLDAGRESVVRVLADTLGGDRFMHLSLGKPLVEAPLIRAAFAAFTLLKQNVDIDELGLMLTSPFFADGISETHQRARLDVALRGRRRKRMPLSGVNHLVNRDKRICHLAPGFSNLIETFVGERAQWLDRDSRRATDWTEHLTRFLAHFGWPGERTLSNEEFQVQRAWNDLLTDFCALDLVVQPMPLSTAIEELERLAGERIHQVRTRQQPVQIMGLAESSGFHFSHLWVLGMSEQAWPPPALPLAFLPARLQRDYGLPSATAPRCFDAALKRTERLIRAAPVVSVSHASQMNDIDVAPSPLIAHLPLRIDEPRATDENNDEDESVIQRDRVFSSLAVSQLERFTDEGLPNLSTGVRGGTQFFSDQAKCPFRAFARHRLKARSPEALATGLDPLERGQLVHDILERVWTTGFTSHAELISADDETLEARVSEAIKGALQSERYRNEQLLGEPMKALEANRLKNLVLRWLDTERARTDDFSVSAVEEGKTETVAGVRVVLRPDRVDISRTSQRKTIIDYKTGKQHLHSWLGERPTDLQLPVYARVIGFENIDAIAFAEVRVDKTKFVGIAREESLPGVTPIGKKLLGNLREVVLEDWQQLSTRLDLAIDTIGDEIAKGHARVDPAPNVCEYCDLTAFCRITRWRSGLIESDGVTDDNPDNDAPFE